MTPTPQERAPVRQEHREKAWAWLGLWKRPDGTRMRDDETMLRSLAQALADAEARWKQPIIDAAVVNWTLTAEHENDPRKAVAALMLCAAQEALDPRISTDAQRLVADAAAEERERCAKEWMPIQDSPLAVRMDALSEKQAQRNHSQSLETLRQRHGISLCEAAALLEERKWKRMSGGEALAAIRAEKEKP